MSLAKPGAAGTALPALGGAGPAAEVQKLKTEADLLLFGRFVVKEFGF